MEKSDRQKSFATKVKSSHFRVANRTYFFDVNLSSNNKKYLKITKSRFMGEGKDRIYDSLVLFPEDLEDFQKSLKTSLGYLN